MIDVILIHSNSDEFRERNLNFILYYYRKYVPNANIILVEQNTKTTNPSIKKFVDKHVKLKTDTNLFCRSLCLNEGFKYAKFDYCLFSDNDCVVDNYFLKNIEQYFCEKLIIPYNKPVINLTESQTKEFISNHETFDRNKGDLVNRGFVSKGGLFFIKRNAYYDVGGYDPRFIGWGGEDDAFFEKTKSLLAVERLELNLFHLYHPTNTNNRNQNPYYTNNCVLYYEYIGLKKEEVLCKINNIGFNHLKNGS